MMRGGKFGRSGATVVVEEFLTGPEVSVLAFTDGKQLFPCPLQWIINVRATATRD